MKVGDYVLTHCYEVDMNFYAYIMGFEVWDDDGFGDYEMVELLADNGHIVFLPEDTFEIVR